MIYVLYVLTFFTVLRSLRSEFFTQGPVVTLSGDFPVPLVGLRRTFRLYSTVRPIVAGLGRSLSRFFAKTRVFSRKSLFPRARNPRGSSLQGNNPRGRTILPLPLGRVAILVSFRRKFGVIRVFYVRN